MRKRTQFDTDGGGMRLPTGTAIVLLALLAGLDGVVSRAQVKTEAPPAVAAAFVDQYISQLRRYRAIAIDVGDMDNLKADSSRLHDVLTAYGIAHDFEIYPGTHTSKVAIRFQEYVMPFFSKSLAFEAVRR